MDARTERARPGRIAGHTANDRFKRRDRRRLYAAIVAAILVHILVFVFGPEWTTPEEPVTFGPAARMHAIQLASDVALPVPPERIAPPAVPRVEEVELAEDIEVEEVADFSGIPPLPELPAPPSSPESVGDALADYEHFMPYMVRPELKNRARVQRALERRYPGALRMGNVEGAVLVVFWIDETGTIQKYEIRQSSGSKRLDAAVEEVIKIMEFRPALSRGEPVKVIVALPIRFRLR